VRPFNIERERAVLDALATERTYGDPLDSEGRKLRALADSYGHAGNERLDFALLRAVLALGRLIERAEILRYVRAEPDDRAGPTDSYAIGRLEAARRIATWIESRGDRDDRDVPGVNREGLTLAEWRAAAGESAGAIAAAHGTSTRAAWERGEDPTEWRAAAETRARRDR
jgi:hypothetical protein